MVQTQPTVIVNPPSPLVAIKRPNVFKLGKWNPDTVLVSEEEELELRSPSNNLLNPCCTRCNGRNVIRAA